MLISDVQGLNAPFPIDVTLSGIATVNSLLQEAKASSPIAVTPFGIVIPVRLEHPQNALSAIDSRLFGSRFSVCCYYKMSYNQWF